MCNVYALPMSYGPVILFFNANSAFSEDHNKAIGVNDDTVLFPKMNRIE